jgi:hypothetical protein
MLGLVAKQRQTCRAVVVALCWGLSGHIGRAQQAASTEPKASPVPTPIPLSEIASQAESTFRSVQNIETTLSTNQVTPTVERRLPALTGEIELRGTEMAKYLTGIVPLELLTKLWPTRISPSPNTILTIGGYLAELTSCHVTNLSRLSLLIVVVRLLIVRLTRPRWANRRRAL